MTENGCICWRSGTRRMLVENCPVHAPAPEPLLASRQVQPDAQILTVLMPRAGAVTVFFGPAMVDLTIDEARQLSAGLVECLAIADGQHPAQRGVRA